MGQSSNRIYALDFTKGVLVLLMVVYHVLNYLEYGSAPHDYMSFLPASFIMITGFLLTLVDQSREGAQPRSVATRLAARAIKLFVLFTVLNLAARLVWSRNRYGADLNISGFIDDWAAIYLTGAGQGVAFEVLLPISYTLLLAIGVLRIRAHRPAAVWTLAAGVALICAALDAWGRSIHTLDLISAGLLGMGLGTLRPGTVDRYTGSWPFPTLMLAAYAGLLALGLDNYVVQMFVTLVWVVALYSLGRIPNPELWWSEQVGLMGRYSLISYIVQILYLQGAHYFVAIVPAPALERTLARCSSSGC